MCNLAFTNIFSVKAMKNGNASTPKSKAPSSENVDAYKMGASGSQPLIKKDIDSSELMTEEYREILQDNFDKDQDAGNLAQLNQRTKLLPSILLVLDEIKNEFKTEDNSHFLNYKNKLQRYII